jgi:signal transduction histidine kinase/ActR/RegA family two-component response regulator
MTRSLLIIDKEKSYADALASFIERRLFEVHVATSHDEIMVVMDNITPEYIVASTDLDDMDMAGLLMDFKSAMPMLQIIVLTSPESKEDLMQRMRKSVFAYLTKPVNSLELEVTLERARDWVHLKKRLNKYTNKLGDLHQANTLYQQLFDEVPCYISVQNRQFRITASNRMFKRHFGDGVGECCYKVYKHRNGPCTVCPVAETFEDGKQHSTEEIVVSKDGERFHVLTWTAPIRDENGVITQVMEMSTNITLLRQLQNHLEFLGMMLGSMSHGVKGMLTALDGSIYQLETGLTRNEEERTNNAFEMLKQVAERIKKMVLDILYYAKSRELDYQVSDIKDFALSICSTVEPSAEKRDVKFEYHIAESGQFDVDPNWFQSAIINILENAIDACAADTDKSEHRVDFEVSSEDGFLVFKIRDNGTGMDPEDQKKAFKLFFSSKGSKGTGLGLFIASHVITQHGGNINVQSETGKGTEFTIRMPRFRSTEKKENEIWMRPLSKTGLHK